MGRKVEVCVEGAGDGVLSAIYDSEALRGKTFEDIARDMVKRDWSGVESKLATSIGRDISGGTNCKAVVLRREGGRSVRLPAVNIHTPITSYVTKTPQREQDVVYVQLLKNNSVGYF